MKKMFLSLVALMAAAVSFAQSTLVATLSHGDEITMYYGSGALGNALSAAVSGDVINLSGGTFDMPGQTISKAVTIRGTGIDAEFPTILSGYFYINIPSSDTYCMSMEGVRCNNKVYVQGTFEKAHFLKSQFTDLYWQTTSNNKRDFKICNCKITKTFQLEGCSTVNFINSVIFYYYYYTNNNAHVSFLNCNVQGGNTINASFINSVLYGNAPNGTCIAMNCIAIGDNYFRNLSTAAINCQTTNDWSSLFKNFRGIYSEGETYELTDEAKATYLGTDGKEVGMYGGDLPYSSTPSYPQITKMNVANKTTADGKLSVEIEVSAAE